MQQFGQLLLLVTFFVTLATALAAMAGAIMRHSTLMRTARYGLFASAGLYVAMSLVLTHGFLTHDFANKYVAAYSDRSMPTLYLLASFWGGEKGALLLWTTALSIFGSIAIYTRRQRDPVYLSWTLAVLALAIFFFDVLMVFESNPFETFVTSAGPMDGKGLNPLLQNPTMAFHPPTLLTGYIAFTIPFAFGMAALITGKLDSQWITDSRTWTIISWCFLSVGLVLGALWAYQELGWGFYWMWDPVENAGFIPWLTGTAYLHSVMIQERRGMLRRWNVVLVCLTFFLTIFGTFLTRSQLIDSIHAFADSTLAQYFLWYMLVLVVVSTVLIAYRWKDLRSEHDIESLWSRESMFVMNNVFLVGCAFIVMWGTLFPKVSELESVQSGYNVIVGVWNGSIGSWFGSMETLDQAVSLAEPWFNRVIAPLGIGLLLIMGLGPLVPWRRASLRMLRKNVFAPVVASFLVTLLGSVVVAVWRIRHEMHGNALDFWPAYDRWTGGLEAAHAYTFLAYFFGLFVTWSMLREFHVATRIRQGKFGGPYVGNLAALTFKSPRRYGGYTIHLGIVMMFIAFTGKVFKTQQPERPVNLGDEISTAGYHLTYSEMDAAWHPDDGFASTRASITVLEDGETVAPGEVDDLVAWLSTMEVGVFHVETELESPKMRVRLQDPEARARLRDDFYLGRSFLTDFVRVAEDAANHRQTWRLRDMGLVKVVPRLAMRKARDARASMGPGTTIETAVKLAAGSPEIVLSFDDEAAMAAFDARLEALSIPDSLRYGKVNVETGSMEFIDSRTGEALHPEVRFFAKHDTPTTETAISSSLYEDLYLAMRPSMGQGFINLLTVVFPLVSFLWTGAIVLIIGTLICLTPPWLGRTITHLARGGRAAAAVLVACVMVASWAPSPLAAMPEPRGMTPPAGGRALDDTLAALGCGCGGLDAAGARARTLAAADCVCAAASMERALVETLMAGHSAATQRSGRAKLDVLRRLTEIDATWDARLRYDVQVYETLLSTTKTTCPGERGLVLSQAQISCSVRNLWLPRFRQMLASGMTAETIYRFYVDENNATMAPPSPWTYQDLRANPDKALSWAFPAGLVLLLLGLLVVTLVRLRRRPTTTAPQAPVAELSARHRLLLEDELDLLDG